MANPVPYCSRSLWRVLLSTTAFVSVTPGFAQTPPPMAAAVGYNVQTLGPGLRLGLNWFPNSWSGNDPRAAGVTQNADGSVAIAGGGSNHYNAQLVTTAPNGSRGCKGSAFGGGGYFEATLSFKNPPAGWGTPAGKDGWPSFWGWPVEADLGLQSYPWFRLEVDFVEFMTAGSNTQYSTSFIYWTDNMKTSYGSREAGIDSTTTVPPSDFSKPHSYGFLWVPATATSQGYGKSFFDGVQVGPTYTWKVGDRFGSLDSQHLQLLLGTGSANPMTVYAVQVWQKSAAHNMCSPTGIKTR